MKSSITRTLAVLASLAACFGFVSSAGAQGFPATYVSVGPTTVLVNMADNPSFELTYKTNANDGVCSSGGEFSTAATGGNRLGGINKTLRLPNASNPPQTAKELVTIPASVLEEIKRRRITSEIFYRRDFATSCTPSVDSFTTVVKIPVLFASVEATPNSARVATGTDTLVSLRWKANLGSDVSYRVESREGRFVDSRGRVYGPVVREPLQATGRGPLEFGETLRVPESVVKAALGGGEPGVRYERLFSFGATEVAGTIQVTGAVQLSFAGRIAAPFSIDRAELQFLDGSSFKTVPLGEQVQLGADITFSGSGRLQGWWELAGPTTTPGAPIFVRKGLVDEYLSFGRRALIRSPAFKADVLGTSIVRLVITAPNLGEDGILQLNFVVRATGETVEISLGVPPPLARLSPGLSFTWETVAGTRNYLLEFYEVPNPEGREPAAGMVLPGSANRADLSQATERNFQPGRTYWWRVVALGPDGALLGQSALRELLIPQQ